MFCTPQIPASGLRRLWLAALLGVVGAWGLPSVAGAADAGFWVRALSATEERRHEDVVRELSPVRERVRGDEGDLLLALALARLDRHEEALARLPGEAAIASWPEEVQDMLEARRRGWAARAGRCDGWEKAEQTDPGLRVAAARCALSQGDTERALALLEGLERVDARQLTAQALAARGDDAAALRVVRALWVSHPAHADSETWRKRLVENDPDFAPSYEERMARAEAWMEARRFQTAVEELKGLKPRGSKGQRAALWHLRGTALYRTRNQYAQAARALSRAARLGGRTEASDVFHAARARSRAGQNERAIRDYRRFAKRYPKNRRVALALYLAAWLEAREGRPKAASRALAKLATHPALARDSRVRDNTLWELGWQAHERELHLLAARHFTRYAGVAYHEREQARGHYWAGVSLAAAGRGGQARAALQRAAHAEPLGYYAALAHARVRSLGLPGFPAFPQDPEEADLNELAEPEVSLPEAARFYAKLSLTQLAAQVISERKGLQRAERIALLLRAGEPEASHRAAHALRRQLFQTPPSEATRWLWRALYPKPFTTAVETQCRRRKLPASLLYAHMLVESRFDPSAVSGAGARGLLQLMPGTAKRVAATLDEESSRERLLNPAFNIELGSTYLSRLIGHFEGALPPAIAAYNAGRGNVGRWIAQTPGPLDEWVERIPISQTRDYVRRVLSHYGRYRYLEDAERWRPELPETLGEADADAGAGDAGAGDAGAGDAGAGR